MLNLSDSVTLFQKLNSQIIRSGRWGDQQTQSKPFGSVSRLNFSDSSDRPLPAHAQMYHSFQSGTMV